MSRPFIPAPHAAMVEFIYAYNTVVAENTLHVMAGTDFDTSMVAALWDIAKNWYNNSWKGNINSSCVLNRIKVRALHASDAPVLDTAVLPNIPGTQSSTSLSNNATFAIKFSTGYAGRTARGRWYVCGLNTAQSANGVTISGGAAANMVSAFIQLQSDLGAQSMVQCIISYRFNNAWRTEALSREVIGVSYTDLNMDSMRRRLAGRGR